MTLRSVENDIIQALTCPICVNYLKNARTLPSCLHSFCLQCLEEKIPPGASLFTCPECKAMNYLGSGGPKDLKFVENVEDAVAETKPISMGESSQLSTESNLSSKMAKSQISVICSMLKRALDDRVASISDVIDALEAERLKQSDSKPVRQLNLDLHNLFPELLLQKTISNAQLSSFVKWDFIEQEPSLVNNAFFKAELQKKQLNLIADQLHAAISENSISAVKLLLDRLPEKSLQFLMNHRMLFQGEDLTALHIACFLGRLPIVQYLVETVKADLFGVTQSQQTCLHLATIKGQLPVIEYLYKREPILGEKKNKFMSRALHLAAHYNHADVMEFFMKQRMNADARGFNASTPLHYAALTNATAVVKVLLQNHANHLAMDKNGKFPIHLAAESGSFDVVKLLVEFRPELLEMRDGFNSKTPFEYAYAGRHVEIADFIFAEISKRNSSS